MYNTKININTVYMRSERAYYLHSKTHTYTHTHIHTCYVLLCNIVNISSVS